MDPSKVVVKIDLPLGMLQTIIQHLAQGKFLDVIGPINYLQQAGDRALAEAQAAEDSAQKTAEALQAELARLRSLAGEDGPKGQPDGKIDPATPLEPPATA